VTGQDVVIVATDPASTLGGNLGVFPAIESGNGSYVAAITGLSDIDVAAI
jgi:hypothetical protein